MNWSYSLGDSSDGSAPVDTLMVELDAERAGDAHPLTGVPPISSEEATSRHDNPINGHEWNVGVTKDLQYTCIFDIAPLYGSPRDCHELDDPSDCECPDEEDAQERKKPFCQDDQGEYGSVQFADGARPSPRQLQVVRELGSSGLVGSVCPKFVSGDVNRPSYGYNPAMLGLTEGLAAALE